MELFSSHINQVKDFLDRKKQENKVIESVHQGRCGWPRTKNKTVKIFVVFIFFSVNAG